MPKAFAVKAGRIFGVSLALSLALGGSAFAANHWTQFRAHASNNAVIGGNLNVQWEVLTDGRISASPTFANGTVFIGTNAGTMYAIRANTGQILWKHHVANALMSA